MSIKYRPEIDGLRAIAVLLVIIYHAFPRAISGGFVGVDVFFVISGFLISSIIIKEINSQTFSFKNFYYRRTRRILPALLIVLLSVLGFGFIAMTAQEFRNLGSHVLSGLLFTSNIQLWRESGYFDISSELKPLLHLWSLGIEEQFYIFWPIVLLLIYKFKKSFLKATLVIALLSFLLNLAFINKNPSATFYLLPTRAWELLAGAILALLPRNESKKLSNSAVMLGLFAILFSAFYIQTGDRFPGYLALFPVIGAGLIIFKGGTSNWAQNILGHPIMTGLGKISYPLYLWHWPLFSFIKITTPEISFHNSEDLVLKMALIVLSVLLATLTYLLVEKRILILSMGAGFKMAKPLGLFSAVTAVLAGLIVLGQGFPSRTQSFLDKNKSRLYYFDSTGQKAALCRSKYLETVFYAVNDETKAPDVLLMGDSIANQYFPGMSQYFAAKNLNLLVLGDNSTPALIDVANDDEDLMKTNNKVFDYALKNESIKHVILAFTDYTDAKKLVNLASRDEKVDYAKALQTTVRALQDKGKKVTFLLINPVLRDFDHHQCIDVRPFRLFAFKKPEVCGVSLALVQKDQERYRRLTLNSLGKNVQIFDPVKYLCDSKYCYGAFDDTLLYAHDNKHLSIEGSYWLANYFDF